MSSRILVFLVCCLSWAVLVAEMLTKGFSPQGALIAAIFGFSAVVLVRGQA